jgi:DNA-directed RNA polymerase subunit RPC12/RpoP
MAVPMEFRCHNCGHRTQLDKAKTGQEFACPSCGVTIVVPHRDVEGPEPRPTERTLRRVFEPIPRPVAYLVGTALVVVLISPFWVWWLRERLDRSRIVLSDDVVALPPPVAVTNELPAPPVLNEVPPELTTTLDQFRGVRLDAAREDVQRRFGLRLQNTRGMMPEIYEATRSGGIELLTAHFYGNLLKEFTITLPEERTPPDFIQQQLETLYGMPAARSDTQRAQRPPSLGLGLPNALGVAKPASELDAKLAGFSYQRALTWSDAQDRVEATIYYSSTNFAECTSMLAVHISAAGWLESNRPQMQVVAPVAPVVPAPETPVEADTPKRLFP